LSPAAIRARLHGVRERIARAARRVGRDPASVRLVAVSKTFPPDAVRAAFEAGQTEFGENKVQEALGKIEQTADLPLTWHLIGHLQSNKVRKVAGRFHVVQSLDGGALAARLDEAARDAGRELDVLVQVDLAGEVGKHGVRPDELLPVVDALRGARALRLKGLMLLPPAVEDPDEARPYFAALRRLRDDLVARGAHPEALGDLSMGMSHDFEVAVEEGATIVRIGTAIFGPRGAGARLAEGAGLMPLPAPPDTG
jgi:pyridoxal phosphate enzyme (YggS family)